MRKIVNVSSWDRHRLLCDGYMAPYFSSAAAIYGCEGETMWDLDLLSDSFRSLCPLFSKFLIVINKRDRHELYSLWLKCLSSSFGGISWMPGFRNRLLASEFIVRNACAREVIQLFHEDRTIRWWWTDVIYGLHHCISSG